MATTSTDQLTHEDLADIQGLIVRGYNMPAVRHFVLTIGETTAALAFLRAVVPGGNGPLKVTSAKTWPANTKPDWALNIGISAAGLEALKLPNTVSFGALQPGPFQSFLDGAVAKADTVGDVGPSSPETWVDKLATPNASQAHLLLSLYTQSDALRETHSTTLREMFADMIPSSGSAASVYELDVDVMVDMVGDREMHKIHFGYTDGISNPTIESVIAAPPRPNQLPNVEPWRFVLRDDPDSTYNPPTPPAFGLNGSFSAFRILEQDVAAFDAFLAADNRTDDEQEFLASKLCGRWRNGNPVVACPDAPGEVLDAAGLSDFDYGTDQVGEPCPYSAHTRRTNPRGGPGVAGVANKRAFRIMRRANPYGPKWTGDADGHERGLAGHFIGASLTNQFEFIMSQWVNNGDFAAQADMGRDPLLGEIPEKDGIVFPYFRKKKRVDVPGLTQFITTRGGLYCFLPSLTSLQWIADNGNSDNPWTIPT